VEGRTAAGLVTFTAAFGALLIWWQRIAPSTIDLGRTTWASMTTGTADGNRITLRNVRNFDWRSNTDYTQRWETRHYDLDRLNSVDRSCLLDRAGDRAHADLIRLDDGEHVVFSVKFAANGSRAFPRSAVSSRSSSSASSRPTNAT